MSDDRMRQEPSSVETVTIGVPTGEVPVVRVPNDEIVVAATPRIPRRVPGVAALAVAVLTIVATTVAVALATGNDDALATQVAWVAIVASGVAVVLGGVAIVLRRGRAWGAAAVVIGVLANPFLLRVILAAVGGGSAA